MSRVIAYARRTLSKSDKNYDAHKLKSFWPSSGQLQTDFMSTCMEGTLRYLPITILPSTILTTTRLDATGQRWVGSLANYNFKLHYKSSKLNVEADVLSRIPWEQEGTLQTVDAVIVKTIIRRSFVPEITPHVVSVVTKSLVVDGTTELSKHYWKMVQQADPDIGLVIALINNKHFFSML